MPFAAATWRSAPVARTRARIVAPSDHTTVAPSAATSSRVPAPARSLACSTVVMPAPSTSAT